MHSIYNPADQSPVNFTRLVIFKNWNFFSYHFTPKWPVLSSTMPFVNIWTPKHESSSVSTWQKAINQFYDYTRLGKYQTFCFCGRQLGIGRRRNEQSEETGHIVIWSDMCLCEQENFAYFKMNVYYKFLWSWVSDTSWARKTGHVSNFW